MPNVVEWPDEAITEKRAIAAVPLMAVAARIDRLAERAAAMLASGQTIEVAALLAEIRKVAGEVLK